ncbi:MAG: DUF1330 domain-containing protein [Shimia sp.]|nr:DUF1330 domain-containing protein [Shimia sp.]
MSAYFIAQIGIRDPEEYQSYLNGYDEVFARYKGKVIAVDDKVTVLEGEWSYGRTVIIRFPSRGDLLAWYESPEYQTIAQHRRNASVANIVAVKGRE